MRMLEPPEMLSAFRGTVRPMSHEMQRAQRLTESLTVQVVRDGEAMAALREEWGELLADSEAGIFNSWEWLYPWWRRLGSERTLYILVVREAEGRLVGLMPLSVDKRRAAGHTVRRLAFLGDTHVGSDYLDIVARHGHERSVTLALMAALRDSGAEWDVLDLLDIESESPIIEALKKAFAGGDFKVEMGECSVCPYETFTPGETFDAFLRRTSRRENFMRRRKWLEKQPGYTIKRVEDPDSLPAPLAEWMRLHALRWEAEGGSQALTGREVEAFHRDATQYLAESGHMRLYVMEVEGKAVATVYAILHGGKFIYYQSGYDPEWRSKSVGMVLIGETFRDSVEAGMQEYDFLRGPESYKADWVSQERHTVSVRIYRTGGPGEWLGRAEGLSKMARSLIKRALPAGLVEKIRRFRRGRGAE